MSNQIDTPVGSISMSAGTTATATHSPGWSVLWIFTQARLRLAVQAFRQEQPGQTPPLAAILCSFDFQPLKLRSRRPNQTRHFQNLHPNLQTGSPRSQGGPWETSPLPTAPSESTKLRSGTWWRPFSGRGFVVENVL